MGDVTWIIFGIFFSGLAFQTISETFASFGDFNPTLIRPLNSSHPYCSYFQNRMPLPAPELRNCSWYKKVSQILFTSKSISFIPFQRVQPFLQTQLRKKTYPSSQMARQAYIKA
jgi:hypothetical protein